MNDKQKEYTVKKINEYNERIDSLYYRINRNALFTFCGVSLAVAIFAINGGEFSGDEIFDNLIGTSSTGFAAYNGIKAVQRICERAGLEHTVRDLEYNLHMSKLEQEKPKEYTKEI